MIGYIHDDMYRLTKLLPPGVKVIFFRATEQFYSHLNQSGVQNGHFQCNFVREKVQDQPRVDSCGVIFCFQ